MAIDTQAKRMAALGFSGSRPELPFPDGTIDADDKFVLLGLYPFAASTGGAADVKYGAAILGRFLRMGRRRKRPRG